MGAGINGRLDLAGLAARLSADDGDGHHWDERDARLWLLRMGFVADENVDAAGSEPGARDTPGGAPAGSWADDPRLRQLLKQLG